MGKVNNELSVTLEKFLGLKQLVDSKAIKKKEACKFLGISYGTYNKLSTKIDVMKSN